MTIVAQNWCISVHLVNHHYTQLNADTKYQASNRHILIEFASSLKAHPLWVTLYILNISNEMDLI